MIICQTPLRISFFGGGTDFPEFFEEHGGAVLASAIDKNIYHSVTRFPSPLFDYSIRLAYRKVECVTSIDEIEHAPFRETLRSFGIERDVEISLAADLPSLAGLGSSSSFTVGLIHALSAFQGRSLPRRELAQRAIQLERGVLRECVGCQDQVMAAYGGINLVEFHREDHFVVNRVPLRNERLQELDQSLLLLFTGTKRHADGVEKAKINRLDRNKARLSRMLKLVERAHTILVGNRPLSAFGELLHKTWLEKRALGPGVSNPAIDAMYERALAAGAIGGKLLGAGGGGFLLLYVPIERQKKFRGKMGDFFEVPFSLNAPGSTIVNT